MWKMLKLVKSSSITKLVQRSYTIPQKNFQRSFIRLRFCHAASMSLIGRIIILWGKACCQKLAVSATIQCLAVLEGRCKNHRYCTTTRTFSLQLSPDLWTISINKTTMWATWDRRSEILTSETNTPRCTTEVLQSARAKNMTSAASISQIQELEYTTCHAFGTDID